MKYHFLTVKTKSEVVLMKEFKLCKIMIKNLTFQMHAGKKKLTMILYIIYNINKNFQSFICDCQCEQLRIMRMCRGKLGLGEGSDEVVTGEQDRKAEKMGPLSEISDVMTPRLA